MGGAGGSIVTLRDNIVNLLEKQNNLGADYDISYGLKNRVRKIVSGPPSIGIPMTELPAVFVHVSSMEQDINTLGPGAHRQVNYAIELYANTNYAGAGMALAYQEGFQLTENLVKLARSVVDLSMTGHWVDHVEVEMDVVAGIPGSADPGYNRLNRVTLSGHELVTS